MWSCVHQVTENNESVGEAVNDKPCQSLERVLAGPSRYRHALSAERVLLAQVHIGNQQRLAAWPENGSISMQRERFAFEPDR